MEDTKIIYRFNVGVRDLRNFKYVNLFDILTALRVIGGYTHYPVPGEPFVQVNYWFNK